jgi:uncharacterized membrane protein
MESKSKVLGHAVHPMLVVFPLGLLGSAVTFDMVSRLTKKPTFATIGFWNMVGGVLGGVVAAPFGWRDWFALPHNTRAKGIGLVHGLLNVVVLLMFAAIAWNRRHEQDELSTPVLVAESLAMALSGVGAWFGGELVDRLGVGVTPHAHLDAPSSLSDQPVTSVPICRVE